MSRPRLSQATKFTLFSTVFLLSVLLFVYAVLVAEMIADENNPAEVFSDIFEIWHVFLFVAAGILSFTISGIIIDSIYNPLRQMSAKMAEVSNINFGKPLLVDASDDELRDVAYAFNTMTAKLSRYINMQKQFVQDASHELATPITVINGHTDLLIRRGGENPELVAESLRTIKKEVERMSGLVDGLLLLAKNDGGSFQYQMGDVDLVKLVHETGEEARLLNPGFKFEVISPALDCNPISRREAHPSSLDANAKSLGGTSLATAQIHCEQDNDTNRDSIFAICDHYAIQRVLRILVSNAVKYANPGSTITLLITAGHGMITVSVKNLGEGIAAEHLERIFERFYRVDPSRDKKTGSSGLGLAIAREIIAAHGGEIYAKSEAGWVEVSFKLNA